MSFYDFFSLLGEFPILILCLILIVSVVFVNGWTDAPNAIATCISTKSIKPKYALLMAAICNLIGVMAAFFFMNEVSTTISNIVDFSNVSPVSALTALSASMLGVTIWGVFSWFFGIPSSESHSLIGGLTGAGLACMTLRMNVTIPFGPTSSWAMVLYGLFGSILFGFFVGLFFTKFIEFLFRKANRNHTRKFFKWCQICSGGCLAFAHGAQDGLKFVGIFLMAIQFAVKAHNLNGSNIIEHTETMTDLWWVAIIVAIVMAIGTCVGGYRIIKKIGQGLSKMEPYQGFCSDLTRGVGILLATYAGLPISTGQVATSSILGVGATKGIRKVKWNVFLEMVITWICCFPSTILIGYLFTLLFLKIPGLGG